MRKVLVPGALAVALLAAGCGGGRQPQSTPLQRFIAMATAGVSADIAPLASPADAVTRGDLIVEGTLTEISEGISLKFPNEAYTKRRANTYMTFVLTVDRVISGDPAKVTGGRVYLAVHKSSTVDTGRVAAANPRPRTIAVLDDITDWTPARDVRVIRPVNIPANASLYAPYHDGMWLQATDDAVARGFGHGPGEVDADTADEASPQWARSVPLAEVAAVLDKAVTR
jgi:hypothetical protein